RQVLDDVWFADWAPNGQDLAVIRSVDGQIQLEYPVGRVLRRPFPYIDDGAAMRVSPRGDRVAVASWDGTGKVTVFDRSGGTGRLPSSARSGGPPGLEADPRIAGLAGDPAGEAVWVGGGRTRRGGGLWPRGLDGAARGAARLPGPVAIKDVSRDGRFLVHVGFEREGVRGKAPDEASERDLCPMISCENLELSIDGRQLLLRDRSQTAGAPPALPLL